MFRQRWCEPNELWYNKELASRFDAVLDIRRAFNAVISSDKPGNHDVIIACSPPLLRLLQVNYIPFTFCVFL